jgi:hypothetical protein
MVEGQAAHKLAPGARDDDYDDYCVRRRHNDGEAEAERLGGGHRGGGNRFFLARSGGRLRQLDGGMEQHAEIAARLAARLAARVGSAA